MQPNRRLPVVLAFLALLAAACESPLPCDGPQQCGGNACCFDLPTDVGGQGPRVYCTGSADACTPFVRINQTTTRLCETDADCTAGGISTVWVNCCPSSVMNRFAKTCGPTCNRSTE